MYGDKRESGSLGRMALVLGGVSGSGSSWVVFLGFGIVDG